VVKIEWGGVIYENNSFNFGKTFVHMVYRTLTASIPSFFKVKKLIKNSNPDVLITDGEPISFYAGKLSGLKCISIDNPQALLYRKYPLSLKDVIPWSIFSIAVKLSIFNADKYLIYDFSDKQIVQSNIIFLKPLIQQGIQRQSPIYGNHIFVYQTSTSNNQLLSLLERMNEKFIIYGFNKKLTKGNLHFKNFNENEFYQDISQAKAVITNGGFTVLSEALFLKKPIFSIPLRNQFEQIVNGKFITQLGVGVSVRNASEQNLKEFISKIDTYKNNLMHYQSGKQHQILEVISEEIENI
jgi:uncharacterized protein (TIGR00661 family)